MDRPLLAPLPPGRVEEAALLLARANLAEGLFEQLFPAAQGRERSLVAQFALRLRWGLRRGEVLATSAPLSGVSVWLPGAHHRIPGSWQLGPGGWRVLAAAGARAALRLAAVNRFYARRHDRLVQPPHLYLAAIAVSAEARGRGIAGAMLREKLADADVRGLPVFLEARTPANVELYRHFGFEVVDEARVPGTTTTDWAMLRPQRGERARGGA